MFGKTETQVCSECGIVHEVELGITRTFEDDKGEFSVSGAKCECGHVLNKERIVNAKDLGVTCF